MKWCFLLNEVPFLMKFLGNLACEAVKEGDECIILVNSKIAEYDKKRYFPANARFLSKVDWCAQYYQKDKNDFGETSWREFFADFDRYSMFSFDYENSIGIMSQLYQFFDVILKKESPDVVINEPPANTCTGILYFLCKKYAISYFGLAGSRFNDYIDVYDTEYTNSNYEKEFKKMDNNPVTKEEKEFASVFLEKFLAHTQLPSYQKSQKKFSKRLAQYIKRQTNTWNTWNMYLKKRTYFRPYDYESELALKYNLYSPFLTFKGMYWNVTQKNIFNSPRKDDTFFLFPLQLQPEASISVLATYFSNQINTVKNIAFCLPLPYKLYVKEHPSSVAHRPKKFYEELEKIPNVVLISAYENVPQLIKRSQGIITLTSTVGMEAALCGKRTYVLGNATYSYHPLCKKIYSFEELKREISNDLESSPLMTDLEDINIRFVVSYFRHAVPGDFDKADHLHDTNNYKLIYENLKRKIPKKED